MRAETVMRTMVRHICSLKTQKNTQSDEKPIGNSIPDKPITNTNLPDEPPDNNLFPVPQIDNLLNLRTLDNENSISEESSSEESEFVDATQMNDPVDPVNLNQTSQRSNAQFLKKSWANLSEALEDDESDNDDEEFDPELLKFQLVMSKYQKNKIRHKAKSKASYHTRSQSGTSKPF
ncbi:unnamed protein product [Vicia faba]|uniref:Uncharacterized protein n=1 Tax=Vicia faba TaxID=3906 RepID=A0AAV0YZ15_VICFA|nr:unnamed protein product [Vicia faba]